MAERTPKESCTQHTIEINNLKKDMETRIRHEERLTKTIENLEVLVDKLNTNYYQINSSLLHIKDIPEKVRKLEDKSIVITLIEKGLWFIIGIGITVIIQQNYIATTRGKEKYNVEKHR